MKRGGGSSAGPGVLPVTGAPLVGLPPLVRADCRVLILGSFPGAASLAAGRYYAHPRNRFWPVLQAIWPQTPMPAMPGSYEKVSDWLADRGLGLWDVIGRCMRDGSLDSAIRAPEPNDITALVRGLPALQAIVHNGGESARCGRHLDALGLPRWVLPSTSPANARWALPQLVQAWREAFVRCGLLSGPTGGGS